MNHAIQHQLLELAREAAEVGAEVTFTSDSLSVTYGHAQGRLIWDEEDQTWSSRAEITGGSASLALLGESAQRMRWLATFCQRALSRLRGQRAPQEDFAPLSLAQWTQPHIHGEVYLTDEGALLVQHNHSWILVQRGRMEHLIPSSRERVCALCDETAARLLIEHADVLQDAVLVPAPPRLLGELTELLESEPALVMELIEARTGACRVRLQEATFDGPWLMIPWSCDAAAANDTHDPQQAA